ncbi:MAG: glycosyltransferase family 2 protein [Deltaproteobacteria bacterium]|nr:glycosyltransferase family 2 protein [Deltaproteobacteria bacterium]MBZ0219971.1 glycosyltransferase family 2 protein [Deltaproteobacteria bacterium]
MNRPKVHLIILNWNGKKDTIECLESVGKLSYPNFETIVVDNGSSDGSVEAIKEKFPGLRLIETGENLGFAEGNNVGIRYALKNGAEYVFLLNNDTTIEPDALGHLVDFAEKDEKVGIVGPKILFYSEPGRIWFAGGIVDFDKGSSHRGGGRPDDGKFDEAVETDYITGCAFLIKAGVISEVGLMSPDYFLLFEETDWCLRARRAGYRIFYVPGARVYHKCSTSFSFGKSRAKRAARAPSWIYYYARNNLLLIKRHLSGIARLKAYLKCLKRNLRWLEWGSPEQRIERLFALLAGELDFLRGRFGKRDNLDFRRLWVK